MSPLGVPTLEALIQADTPNGALREDGKLYVYGLHHALGWYLVLVFDDGVTLPERGGGG